VKCTVGVGEAVMRDRVVLLKESGIVKHGEEGRGGKAGGLALGSDHTSQSVHQLVFHYLRPLDGRSREIRIGAGVSTDSGISL
jgi:hypothetical protein